MKKYTTTSPFVTESGYTFPNIDIAFTTYGKLNAAADNVVWVCHALTADTAAAEWWSGLVGKNKIFDPAKHYIVCANMLGSCYGTTEADSINPQTGKKYANDFPIITIRDIVKAHRLLQKHLNIKQIQVLIGGSMGGQQVLEWAITAPADIAQIIVMAAGAKLNPWSRGWNAAQRIALEADPTLYDDTPNAGEKGLQAARAMGMLCYRTYEAYNDLQKDDDQALDNFRIDSYLRHHGKKLTDRFTARAYRNITRTMDTHNVGRGRETVAKALQSVTAEALIIGISSDILFPINEQIELASHIPHAQLEIIDSPYGHDGFLVETQQITNILNNFLKNHQYTKHQQKKLRSES